MSYEGIVLDVDGTVVRESAPIDGAAEGLAAVDDAGVRRVFCSNNPTKRPEAYEERFAEAGFTVSAEEVFTAGTITTDYLTDEHADDQVFLVGEAGLRDQLVDAGLSVTTDPRAADVVVGSLSTEFDYETLCETIIAMDDEPAFVGTDPDTVIPQDGPDRPGSGAIIHAMEGVIDRSVDVICGKPSAYARETVLDYLGVPAEDCLVVGDRLNTDIELGTAAGMTTALVTTGIMDRSAVADSAVTPDYVIDSLAELGAVIGGTAERYVA
ncbi:HAD-IIA family hydrolase [Halonotius roseus]|uniref:HAD-IIA family hydrolase n=1 Tax=Halonotius roseus TaxID=2511997 RepID=A0A544QL39_9EURY|nr:HAD-IIA family hydrolase [Halonotius roseus]TQQ79084.1 HAD-IIA family hydrolase [Halonotius roseus]